MKFHSGILAGTDYLEKFDKNLVRTKDRDAMQNNWELVKSQLWVVHSTLFHALFQNVPRHFSIK